MGISKCDVTTVKLFCRPFGNEQIVQPTEKRMDRRGEDDGMKGTNDFI